MTRWRRLRRAHQESAGSAGIAEQTPVRGTGSRPRPPPARPRRRNVPPPRPGRGVGVRPALLLQPPRPHRGPTGRAGDGGRRRAGQSPERVHRRAGSRLRRGTGEQCGRHRRGRAGPVPRAGAGVAACRAGPAAGRRAGRRPDEVDHRPEDAPPLAAAPRPGPGPRRRGPRRVARAGALRLDDSSGARSRTSCAGSTPPVRRKSDDRGSPSRLDGQSPAHDLPIDRSTPALDQFAISCPPAARGGDRHANGPTV